uniref:Cell division protease FtsH n=1 Tax=Candidatus Kentrum sp. FM TaxID=2126340 RepID=A0A450VLA2_9GAMM|nr:MAG: cell division protease FtsH [Candidatus Kentron sp. FM]VFJ43337.1 MAG: cell division protease FtsH [Candidatus Kentron sp. FM]VFK05500.1 MAG: cell division protease FtsH [Candidatus Kentron sp. FM]
MQDRHYNDIERLGYFPIPDPDPAKRHHEEAQRAVKVAHRTEIDRAVDLLKHGQSILILCDKLLAKQVLRCVTEAYPAPLEHVTHNDPTTGASIIPQLGRNLAERLSAAYSGESETVVVIWHLDLMCWLINNQPRSEVNDIIFWLTEYSSVVKLAFWDPAFNLPKFMENLFPNRISLQLFDREILWELLASAEARKLSPDPVSFTVAAQLNLYQYLSGVNVVELRRILRSLPRSLPEHPQKPRDAYDHIRRQTATTQPVPEPAQVTGYLELRKRLEQEILFPVRLRYGARDATSLRQADVLIPRGVVLYGPPGTGKTEWAKWLARELGATLWLIHGPELISKYVGETEAAIRRVFAQARRSAPSLILIDEIDALTPSRQGSGRHFEASMVAQFLTEMDGLRKEEAVMVVGTTNRLEALDKAFLRPSRFGNHLVEVGYPDDTDRRAILEHYDREFDLGLKKESVNFLVQETEGSLRDQRTIEYQQFLKSYLAHQVDPEFREAAGPELTRRMAQQLGLDPDPPRISGDHLRAICLHLLRESLSSRRQVNERQFLEEALRAVWQRETALPMEWSANIPWTDMESRF